MTENDSFAEKKDGLTGTPKKRSDASPVRALAVLLLITHAFLTIAVIILGLQGLVEGGYAIFVSLFALPVLLASGICCLNGVRGRGVAGIVGSVAGLIAGIMLFCEVGPQTLSIGGLLIYGLSLAGYARLLSRAGKGKAAPKTAPSAHGAARGSANAPACFGAGSATSEFTGEGGAGAGGEGETETQGLLTDARETLSGRVAPPYTEKPRKPPLGVWLLVLLYLINFALYLNGISALNWMKPASILFRIVGLLIPLCVLYFIYLKRRGAVLGLLALDLIRRLYFFSTLRKAVLEQIEYFGYDLTELIFTMEAYDLFSLFGRPLGFILVTTAFLLYVGFSRNAAIYFYGGCPRPDSGR